MSNETPDKSIQNPKRKVFETQRWKSFAAGFLFVPSSLGLVASSTPAEFKDLVKAAYFLPDKWNTFLNWLPLPKFLTADIINILILSVFCIRILLFAFSAGLAEHGMTLREFFRTLSLTKWSKKSNFDNGFDLLRSFALLLTYFAVVIWIINIVRHEVENIVILSWVVTYMIIGAGFSKEYRNALTVCVGVLVAMQLLYWGNFTDWFKYL